MTLTLKANYLFSMRSSSGNIVTLSAPDSNIILQQQLDTGQQQQQQVSQGRASSQPLSVLKTVTRPQINENLKRPQENVPQPESQYPVTMSTTWHHDQNEDYKMTSSPRGICLIINNVDFDLDMFPKRKGSDKDAFRFKDIFKQMGFSVESKRNVTADKMKAIFKQVAARCLQKHDALVVILLSHGTESGIYGADGLEVDMHDILTNFDNRRCKNMIGKPKVFIVQACRGRMADHGVRDTQSFFSQPESQSFTQPSQFTQINLESPKISRWSEVDRNYHPTRTDMVLCFSCNAGFVSTRNEEEGSWLGTSLAEHLQTECCRRHLLDIFNMVSRDVRRRKSTDGYKQVLEVNTIGFDRNLYFNPGLCEDQKTVK